MTWVSAVAAPAPTANHTRQIFCIKYTFGPRSLFALCIQSFRIYNNNVLGLGNLEKHNLKKHIKISLKSKENEKIKNRGAGEGGAATLEQTN